MPPKTAGLVFLFSLCALSGCSPKKEAIQTVSPGPVSAVESGGSEASTPLKAIDVNQYYLMASGVTPDWTLDIGTNGIRLRTGEDSYSTRTQHLTRLWIATSNATFSGLNPHT